MVICGGLRRHITGAVETREGNHVQAALSSCLDLVVIPLGHSVWSVASTNHPCRSHPGNRECGYSFHGDESC